MRGPAITKSYCKWSARDRPAPCPCGQRNHKRKREESDTASRFPPHSSHSLPDENRLQLGSFLGYVRLFVLEPLTRVVPQDHFLVRDLHHVLGEERNLPAASGGIDHEVRDR